MLEWKRSGNSTQKQSQVHKNDLIKAKYLQMNTKGNRLQNKQNIRQNVIKTNKVQLFTKLKQSQLQKCKYSSAMANNDNQSHHQLIFKHNGCWRGQNHNSKAQYEKKQIQNSNKQQRNGDIQLSEYQIEKIICLKNQKALLLANHCQKEGKSIKQAMRQLVLPYLNWEIHNIIVNSNQNQNEQKGKFLNNIIQHLTNIQNQKFKNLESTAEYYGSPTQITDCFANETLGRNTKQPDEEDKQGKINELSTIKFISSPQLFHEGQNTSSETFNGSNEECRGIKQNKEQVKVVQFTLGNICDKKQVEEKAKQFEDRQKQDNNELRNMIGNQLIDGSFGVNLKDVEQKSVQSPQNKNANNIGLERSKLCFSRKKVPKGKVIKIRVMGNSNNDNTVLVQ